MNPKESQKQKQLLSEIIRSRRLFLGITQAELATRCGVGLATVERLEAAKFFPRFTQLLDICNILRLVPTFIEISEIDRFDKRVEAEWVKALKVNEVTPLPPPMKKR